MRRLINGLGLVIALVALLHDDGGIAMDGNKHDRGGPVAWATRDSVRAFYSGHSLSEGVPEAVEQIAASLGHRLLFETQVLGYSLLRERTRGASNSNEWTGYRAGSNRSGQGLDVAAELRQPSRLGNGEVYDVLVVTERHDLPAIARQERTAYHLVELAKNLLLGNPDAEVLFYHTWLHLDPAAPLPWIQYERTVATMWECIASRANLDLPPRGDAPRVKVLPGAGALAELTAALWEDRVPGVKAGTPEARVRLLFSDNVHMSETGRYFIALVHYAVLFGRSPVGARTPAGLAPETGRYMQTLAAEYASSYGATANVAARRDMAVCRGLMQEEVCPAYAAFRPGSKLPVIGLLRRQLDSRSCGRDYGDASDPENPFASSGK